MLLTNIRIRQMIMLTAITSASASSLYAQVPTRDSDERSDAVERIAPLKDLNILTDMRAEQFPIGPVEDTPWMVVRKGSDGTAFFHGATPYKQQYSFSTAWAETASSPLRPGNALELVVHGWDKEPSTRDETYTVGLLSQKDEDFYDQLRFTHSLNGYRTGVSLGKFGRYDSSEQYSRVSHEDANWNTSGANHLVFVFGEKTVSLWINGEFVASSLKVPANGTFQGYAVSGLSRQTGVSRILIYGK